MHFSLDPDIQRLVDAGMVAEDWNQNEYNGIVEDSVVVFVTRPGNPEGVQDWDDLITGDVEVLTPNPFTSGGARWNLMAAYGTKVLTEGASEEEGLQYVEDLLNNVAVQDESARDSLGTFLGGKGDVLLAYENEAIAAQEAGEDIEYVIPDSTILIETPIAVTTEADEAAQAFVDYQYTDEAQQLWADAGYRPVVESVLEAERRQVPDPARPLHDRGPRWLGGRDDRVLRSGERFDRRDRGEPGGCDGVASQAGRRNCAKHRRGRALGSASAAPG